MCHPTKVEWSRRAMENGHNWNSLRLLFGFGRPIQKHRLTAVNLSIKEDHVLIILKKESPKGPMVAFLPAQDLEDALDVMCKAIKGNTIPWKPDKWVSMRSDKK